MSPLLVLLQHQSTPAVPGVLSRQQWQPHQQQQLAVAVAVPGQKVSGHHVLQRSQQDWMLAQQQRLVV